MPGRYCTDFDSADGYGTAGGNDRKISSGSEIIQDFIIHIIHKNYEKIILKIREKALAEAGAFCYNLSAIMDTQQKYTVLDKCLYKEE